MINSSLIIIGNEILSGQTQDANLNYVATNLAKSNLYLAEVAVIRDDEKSIIETVRRFKDKYEYVFTCGGIGPTHDDITTESIAKALNAKLEVNKEAYEILENYYGEDNFTEARKKMSCMPENAKLIYNPISYAPGFYIDNIFVLAGVPSIMRAMFDSILPLLKTGQEIYSASVKTNILEGYFASDLSIISKRFSDLEIGSYPFISEKEIATSLVVRGYDKMKVKQAEEEIKQMLSQIKNR